MIKAPTPKPILHRQIRSDIEQLIMSGEWPAGHRIPVEQALMTQYACSRMTVNKALRALVQAGMLESRKRAGTFVATPQQHRAALEIPDMRSDVEAQGKAYRFDLLSCVRRTATPDDQLLLKGTEGEILAIDCRHISDETPYALEHRLINLAAVPEATNIDFSHEPPGSWLLAHVPWTEAEHRITALNAPTQTAVFLGLEAGAACLGLERWTWRGVDRITYARLIYPGNRHALIAHFHA